MEFDKIIKPTTDVSNPSLLIEYAMKDLKDQFVKNGSVDPVFALECDNGENQLESIPQVGFFLNDNKGKNLLGDLFRGYAKHLTDTGSKPTCAFTCTEAWQSPPIDKDDLKTQKTIEEEGVMSQPDRKEILIFNLETKLQTRMIIYEIIRDDKEQNFVVSPNPIMDNIQDKEEGSLKSKFQVWNNGEIQTSINFSLKGKKEE